MTRRALLRRPRLIGWKPYHPLDSIGDGCYLTVNMREWSNWDWAAFIGLWVAVALSAADQALKLMSELAERARPVFQRVPFLVRVAVAFAPVLLLLFATGIFVAKEFLPRHENAQTEAAADAQKATLIEWLRQSQSALERARQQLAISAKPISVTPPEQAQSVAALEALKRLSTGDRERLADAIYDLSKALDQGAKLFNKVNRLVAQILSKTNNYPNQISGEIANWLAELRAELNETREWRKDLDETREKWRYYSPQIGYILGNDPDNSASSILNGIDEFLAYLTRWSTIKNIDEQPSRELLNFEQNTFSEWVGKFARWRQESEKRLIEIKRAM